MATALTSAHLERRSRRREPGPRAWSRRRPVLPPPRPGTLLAGPCRPARPKAAAVLRASRPLASSKTPSVAPEPPLAQGTRRGDAEGSSGRSPPVARVATALGPTSRRPQHGRGRSRGRAGHRRTRAGETRGTPVQQNGRAQSGGARNVKRVTAARRCASRASGIPNGESGPPSAPLRRRAGTAGARAWPAGVSFGERRWEGAALVVQVAARDKAWAALISELHFPALPSLLASRGKIRAPRPAKKNSKPVRSTPAENPR